MEDSPGLQWVRAFGRVTDRADKCVVNPNFNHWCSKHKMKTCNNHKPLHCNVVGELVSSNRSRTLQDGSKKIHVAWRKDYCFECIGQANQFPYAKGDHYNVLKKTKAELVEMAKEMDPPNEALVEQVNNFYK